MGKNLTDRKLRGGYYTPPCIAEFLAKWAIRSAHDQILEPSCGDGEILEACVKNLSTLGASAQELNQSVHAIELDPVEAEKTRNRLVRYQVVSERVNNSDFFSYCSDYYFGHSLFSNQKRFDAIIGNPPFIRYQDFPEHHRSLAFELMEKAGFHPNRLTNIWAPFLVISSLLLNESGRLAMVIPAELFQVKYAAETRLFLSNFFDCLTIVTFKQLVFPDIQQEIVLVLGERKSENAKGIRVIELENAEELQNYQQTEINRTEVKPLDHSTEKWTQYFLTTAEIELLRNLAKHPKLTMSNHVIDVDVGIVTGNNQFFVLTENEVEEKGLNNFVRTIVTRSAHLPGLRFTDEDYRSNVTQQYPALLFYPPDIAQIQLPLALQRFIADAEKQGLHQTYKCRQRKSWYVVPSVWNPDAFMLRQVHAFPKLILNEVGVTCTDTIHRVKFINGRDGKSIVSAFLNALTFAFSEIKGRSYGGGVLTFEPSEAEELPLPLEGSEQLDFALLDQQLRSGRIEDVLAITDKVLLVDGLGLSWQETSALRQIWQKLRNRRINRK
jgi:adenine-specific DNA-methyltransferase